ncbi:tRNA glutamyl-Q(34) synthetase GluQRS [Granulosicoccaceae sp. 1_MG-2023]|nr:tRNA glutamyl-Q(34) synthetase GluQRS [Granulosicoccaceae sp. 1_MG-2023]
MCHQSPVPAGRFAPSPTGLLHFGSLIAAMGSYLQARSSGARWLLRIEDTDPPREMPGAAAAILRTLQTYGFRHDGDVLYQSRRARHYDAALQQLARAGLLYACDCSRKQIREAAARTAYPAAYPGTCRERGLPLDGPYALRLRLPRDAAVSLQDGIQGLYRQNVREACGDFVLKRRDGLYAYQLAVVVDDGLCGISDVVRGADLLDNTPRQILLQQALGLPTPRYWHLPLIVNGDGEKLSKQTYAAPLDDNPLPQLQQAWCSLGQRKAATAGAQTVAAFWDLALQHWQMQRIPPGPLPQPDSADLNHPPPQV